mmetsp:Transcript_17614/g.71201  ORF Transcript_17614/g.71201 Transcript_17614/m.71201 type:complete len:181 (-) Transcript_17614:864-1406(-)
MALIEAKGNLDKLLVWAMAGPASEVQIDGKLIETDETVALNLLKSLPSSMRRGLGKTCSLRLPGSFHRRYSFWELPTINTGNGGSFSSFPLNDVADRRQVLFVFLLSSDGSAALRIGLTGEEEALNRVQWALAEASKLLQFHSGLLAEVERRMLAGASVGECVQFVEQLASGTPPSPARA